MLVNNLKAEFGTICSYCEKEISPGTVFKSTKQELILHYNVYDYTKDGITNNFKGYKLNFSTELISGW